MDADDFLPARADDPISLMRAQDIDPLSVDELDARIAALLAEVERTQARRAFAVNHKSSAEALFKR
ncbi:MAG: DUF1192 family protein [Sphingopyxis sp.]